MADINLETITPTPVEANDALMVRRGAAGFSPALVPVSAFATAEQGGRADTALQPGADIDLGDVTGLAEALGGKAGVNHTHSNATTSAAGFMAAADKTKLNGIDEGATVNATDALLRARATHTGDELTAAFGVADSGDPTKRMTFDLSAIGAGQTQSLQWPNVTGVPVVSAVGFDQVISGAKTFSQPITLPANANPASPPAGNILLFALDQPGRPMPAVEELSGNPWALAPHPGFKRVRSVLPSPNSTALTVTGLVPAAIGTATAVSPSATSLFTRMVGIEYLQNTASVTAIAGVRMGQGMITIGGEAADRGGFFLSMTWGPATGVATATYRAFAGVADGNNGPTDVEPSSRGNIYGMGWDAADTNIQFMHNDATGTATKIDLGPNFPVPTVDRTEIYTLRMFSPPGTSQSLSYEVTRLSTGAKATGTVTTDLPLTSTFRNGLIAASAGGTSSVVGVKLFDFSVETAQ